MNTVLSFPPNRFTTLSSGAAAGLSGTTTRHPYISFPDNAGQPAAVTCPAIMSQEYTGTKLWHVFLVVTPNALAGETAKFGISWVAHKDGSSNQDLLVAPIFDSAFTKLVGRMWPTGSVGVAKRGAVAGLCDNVAAGDMVQIKIQRLTNDAEDDMTGPIYVINYSIYEE